jgi:hypothetical protein
MGLNLAENITLRLGSYNINVHEDVSCTDSVVDVDIILFINVHEDVSCSDTPTIALYYTFVTPLHDTFTGTGSLSSSWSNITGTLFELIPSTDSDVVKGNFSGSLRLSGAYWNERTYGPDCEVYATLTNTPTSDSFGLILRLTPGDPQGYVVKFAYGSGIEFGKYTAGGGYSSIGTKSVTFSAGDVVGLKAVGNNFYFYKNNILISAWSDSTYAGSGYIGLQFYSAGGACTARLDNFSGGNPFQLYVSESESVSSVTDISTVYVGAASVSDLSVSVHEDLSCADSTPTVQEPNYYINVHEDLSCVDSTPTVLEPNYYINIFESVGTITDTPTVREPNYYISVSESITSVTDAPTVQEPNYYISASESITSIVDLPTVQEPNYYISASESITSVTDVTTVNVQLSSILTVSVIEYVASITDTPTILEPNYYISISESISSITDTPTVREPNYYINVSESISSIVDTPTTNIVTGGGGTLTISVVEIVSNVTDQNPYESRYINAIEYVGISETITASMPDIGPTLLISTSELVSTITDVPTVQEPNYYISIFESVGTIDALPNITETPLLISVSESITSIADAPTVLEPVYYVNIFELVGITDVVSGIQEHPLFVSVFESVNSVTDASTVYIGVVGTLPVNVSESVSAYDTIIGITEAPLLISVSESIASITDVPTIQESNYCISASESVSTITDVPVVQIGVIGTLNIPTIVEYITSITDAPTVLEPVYYVSVSESVSTITDAPTVL